MLLAVVIVFRLVMFKRFLKRFDGFTLAEILITLSVIGIIAAITISILVGNYQKQDYVARLKNAYTSFNRALIDVTNEYGCGTDLACTGLMDASNNAIFGDAISKKFNIIKNCRNASGCFTHDSYQNYDGSGASTYTDGGTDYRFIISNGAVFKTHVYVGNCTQKWWTNGRTGQMDKYCGEVWVDVNGKVKGPNCYGRDIFHFYITNPRGVILYPAGGSDDRVAAVDNWWVDSSGNPKSCYPENTSGSTCAGRIIDEGWQMNY